MVYSTWSQITRRSLATNRTVTFSTWESRFLSTIAQTYSTETSEGRPMDVPHGLLGHP
jgi:hypothetical protein